jgi:hypothetical protein
MSNHRDRQPLTKPQRQDSIFIGCALIALGLVGGFIGNNWAVGLSGVVLGIGLIVWSVWQR